MIAGTISTMGHIALRWTGGRRRCAGAAAALLLTLLAVPVKATAVEYRLQVVSLYEEAFRSLLRPNELCDGASGPGLDRLEASLDRAEFPKGAILWDRHVQSAGEEFARGYSAVVVHPHLTESSAQRLWHELRWEGRPGEQTVWRVSPSGLRIGELDRVALKGRGMLRHFIPFSPPTTNGHRSQALSIPLLYLWAQQERGLWPGYLARTVELSDGIAAVVGVNTNGSFSDEVHLLVKHGEQPMTYKAVLGWRPRDRSHLNDLEAPGVDRSR
jgi:hypothetical protein